MALFTFNRQYSVTWSKMYSSDCENTELHWFRIQLKKQTTKITPVAATGYSVALYKSSWRQDSGMIWEGSLHTTFVSSATMLGLVRTCLGLDVGALQVNRNKRRTCGFFKCLSAVFESVLLHCSFHDYLMPPPSSSTGKILIPINLGRTFW